MKTHSKQIAVQDFILDSTCKSNRRPEYNGLTDPSLSSFFSSPRRRKLLVMQKLITPQGHINERNCQKPISVGALTSNAFRRTSNSPVLVNRSAKKAKTPEDVNARQKLPLIQPMSSMQFKEMLNKRRTLVISNQ